MVFGTISLTFYLMIFVVPPPTPGYAPHIFAYNMGFFLPVLIASLIFGLLTIKSYFSIENRKSYKLIHKLLPFLILIPQGIQIGIMGLNILRWTLKNKHVAQQNLYAIRAEEINERSVLLALPSSALTFLLNKIKNTKRSFGYCSFKFEKFGFSTPHCV